MSNASTTFEASESSAKHLVMVATADFSLVLLPLQSLRSLLIFAPLAIIYLLGNLPAYALMVLIFSVAIPLLSRGIQLLMDRRRIDVVVLIFLVSLVLALLAMLTSEPDALFSDHYGRTRLLLGYWHPKEAAASLAVPIFMYLITRVRYVSNFSMILFPAVLWGVGSRNIALAMYLAIGMRFFPRWTYSIICFTLAGLAVFLLTSSGSYDVLDELTSLRLTEWSDALSRSIQSVSTDLVGGDRLAIDSYYAEVFATSGYLGSLLLFTWAIVFYNQYIRPFQRDTWSRALFIAILFCAAFDSGIVSTGNVFHVFVWVVIGGPIFKRKRQLPKLRQPNH